MSRRPFAYSSGGYRPPWSAKPLDEWAIVGMNHYTENGQKRLFIALVKGDRCIKEEGLDDEYLWNRLWRKAVDVDREEDGKR